MRTKLITTPYLPHAGYGYSPPSVVTINGVLCVELDGSALYDMAMLGFKPLAPGFKPTPRTAPIVRPLATDVF